MTDRTRAIEYGAFVAVVIFAAIGLAIQATAWRPPFWLATPSATAIFGLVFAGYDRYLWQRAPLGIRLSPVPNLNGNWGGFIDILEGPRRDEEGLRDVPCFVRITQTWTKISVEFETPFTRSESKMAWLDPRHLHYEYSVEPKEGTEYPADMQTHGGMARLYSTDWQTLEGYFFNDQYYQRFGKYNLRRLKSNETTDDILRTDAPRAV